MSNSVKHELLVVRYCHAGGFGGRTAGDFLKVGSIDLGSYGDITDEVFRRYGRAQPWFYTGSPFGAEILAIARTIREIK